LLPPDLSLALTMEKPPSPNRQSLFRPRSWPFGCAPGDVSLQGFSAMTEAILADIMTVTATGKSGAMYQFNVYPMGTRHRVAAGVYIFLRAKPPSIWEAIYVGETNNFSRRLNTDILTHNAWPRIRNYRPTHVGVLAVNGHPRMRLNIETDLRQSLQPPCNLQ
jgi:hypothetical protein